MRIPRTIQYREAIYRLANNYYKYNDGRLSGGRIPRLYLAKGSKAVKFQGQNIPGYAAIASKQYEKAGKWSNFTYQLMLAPGVRPIHFVSPLHGTWGDEFRSWGEVIEHLRLPIETVQEIIRKEYKTTAERLDKLEEFSLAIEEEGYETEVVIISFGSPTNRQIREGYWEKPKSGKTNDGQIVTVVPTDDGWHKPIVVEPENAEILSSRYTSGMHGGRYTIEVAVPVSY